MPSDKEYAILIGMRLSEIRKNKGIRRADLAKAMGVSVQAIGLYERGELKISIGRYIQICKILNVNYSTPLDGI